MGKEDSSNLLVAITVAICLSLAFQTDQFLKRRDLQNKENMVKEVESYIEKHIHWKPLTQMQIQAHQESFECPSLDPHVHKNTKMHFIKQECVNNFVNLLFTSQNQNQYTFFQNITLRNLSTLEPHHFTLVMSRAMGLPTTRIYCQRDLSKALDVSNQRYFYVIILNGLEMLDKRQEHEMISFFTQHQKENWNLFVFFALE